MKRLFGWTVVGLLALWVAWSAATLPAASRVLAPGPEDLHQHPVVRGAYHIHSTESDGTASVSQIAEAAHRAGLDFIIVTDHSNGVPPPRAPRYYGGVLCLEALEISTNDGHYAALGMDATPYPLGGDGRDVAEDVRRLGGFGIVAHPDSAKPDLRWKEWAMPIGGFEWFNADSQWRDEHRLALLPSLAHYFFRKPETVAALFDRPVDALAAWDRLSAQGHVVGMAAADAHARLGLRGRVDPYEDAFYLPVPSYEAVFRAFSLQVDLDEPFEGLARRDAQRLLDAIRAGRVTTGFEALAAPVEVAFEGEAAGDYAGPGGDLPRVTPITFRVRSNAPAGATTVLIRNGETVLEEPSSDVRWQTQLAGAFRAEIRLPGAPGAPPVPWVVTNPIYVGVPAEAPGPPPLPPPSVSAELHATDWTIERDAASSGAIQILSPADTALLAAFTYRLAPAPAENPYVAVVTHDVGPLFEADRITFQASATSPMRVSVQLRSSVDGRERRWRRSVYLDRTPREVTVPFADMRGIGEARGEALRVRDVTSLLFVVDRVNTAPGTEGAVTLVNLRAGR